MKTRLRRFREVAALVAVSVLVGGVIVAAIHADARTSVRTQTNDGGAWLVKADAGVIGQVNRAAMEVSGAVSVAENGSDFDVEQDGTLVVVNDRGSASVTLVDPRTYSVINTVEVPVDLQHKVVGDAAVLWTESPLKVWHVSRDQLAGSRSLEQIPPVVSAEGTGLATLTRNDQLLVLDRQGDRLVRVDVSTIGTAETAQTAVPLLERAEDVTAISAVGDDAVLLDDAGAVVIPADAADEESVREATRSSVDIDGGTEGYVLAQPTDAGSPLVAAGPDGRMWTTPSTPPEVADGDDDEEEPPPWTMTELPAIQASEPLAPIVYQGCVFSLAREPVTFTRACGGEEDQRIALDGMDSSALRLRLVNGWVWINDLSTGSLAVIGIEGDIERLDDWGQALGQDDDAKTPPEDSQDDEDRETDSETVEFTDDIAELDEDDINQPPVAQDDKARTRVDMPIVVPVLDNDTDPDGDVILVTDINDVPAQTQVSPTIDQTAIQVVPPAGHTGRLEFSYTITDGRRSPDGGPSSDTARVTVEVVANDAANEAPTPTEDFAEVAAGASVTMNVLDNDTDPEGDSLLLETIEAESGDLTFDPSGRITYRPPPDSSDGELSLPYTVTDTFGASSDSELEVKIRLRQSNNEPVAENDSRSTVVGKPVSFNLLANDSDPDNDPLSTAGLLELRAGPSTALDVADLSPDGEFFFSPTRPGEYVYIYGVTDGSERDRAIVRVDVGEETDNRPPAAIRDDVTIARGSSKTVFVLQNDTDPDGDVVAIESWTKAEGLRIQETRGQGFNIFVEPSAPDVVTFRYSITDGEADPVSGTVVVAVSDEEIIDQQPVAKPDTVDVRPGRSAAVRVLLNDYDPEGGPLTVVGTATTRNADVRLGPGGQEIFVTPKDDVISSFSFAYDVQDEGGNRASSFVQVRPVPKGQKNRPPIARPDLARARAGTNVTIRVAANDSDPDGDAIKVESIATQPAFGAAKVNRDGTVSYRSSSDAEGSDKFEYLLIDAKGDRAIGTVLVGVLAADGVNRPPTAADDQFAMIAGSDPIALDVLANDFDPNGDEISIVEVIGGGRRVEFDEESEQVTFSPPAKVQGESQKFTFAYVVGDGRGETDEGTVTVQVNAKGAPVKPVAVDDLTGPVLEETTIEYDVVANDFDPDGLRGDLTVTSDEDDVRVLDDGRLQIDLGTESDEYEYTITDLDGLSADGVLTVITTPNRAPIAEPMEVDTEFETPIRVNVGAEVYDEDGDDLVFACCQKSRGGRASVDSSGKDELVVRFQPNDGFSGEAGFTYRVDDQAGHDVSGVVVIKVEPPANTPPTAENGTAEAEAGTMAPVLLTPFVSDPDLETGDELSFSVVDAGGAPVQQRGETLRIRPPLDSAGDEYRIRYRVADKLGETDEAVVTVTVTESTVRPPVAVRDEASSMGETVVVPVLGNDQDPLGEGLTIVGANLTSGQGAAEVTGDSTAVAFTPNEGFFGQAAVEYTIQDARGTAEGQATGLLVITVVAKPSPPPAPVAIADNATATVSWQAGADNGAPITAYRVESDQGQSAGAGNANSRTFNGLQNGVAHRFRVQAQNEAGWSDWSEYSAPVTPDTEPGVPAAPSVEFADGALIVAWQEPGNEGSPITDYQLEIGGAASATRSVGTQTSYTWDGLTNGSNYQFRVVAINAAGPSDPSGWSNAEHPLGAPGAPGTPQVTRGNQFLDLRWSQGDPNGDPISRYEVQRRSTGETLTANQDAYTWGNLPNGRPESFRVRAFNRDPDPGTWSGWSVPEKPCGRPDQVGSVTATRDDQAAGVTWTAAGDQGCAIESYTIETDNGITQSTQSTSMTFAPLENGRPYRFRVLATNSEGDGAWSGWSNEVTPAGPPIGPNSASASPTGVGEITVTWDAAQNNGSALTHYGVSINDQPPIRVDPSQTSYRHSGLGEGSSYSYKVQACNDVGCGPYSSSASATTWSRPSQLAAPNVAANDRTLNASWSGPASNGGSPVTGYQATLSPGSTSPTPNTSYQWTNLNYGQTYTVTVQACNAVGCSDPSPGSSATIRGAPGQVATPNVTASGNDVSASWNEPATNGDAIQRYEVDLNPGTGTATDGGTRSARFPDQSYSTRYEVTVRACNGVGCGPWSSPGSATTDEPPPPPPPPEPTRQVVASKGAPCGGPGPPCPSPGSCNANCNFVNINATGFAADQSYDYQCYLNGGPFGSGGSRTTNGAGNYSGDLGCYNGFPGQVHVIFGGERSNDVNW